MASVSLQNHPSKQLFTPAQWAKVEQSPTGRLDDATWSGLSPVQRDAFIALRKELQSDGFGGQAEGTQRRDRLNGGAGGNHFVGTDPLSGGTPAPMKTIAEVIAQAKAAPGHARVKEPWDALPPNRMLAMSMNVENLFREADDPNTDDAEYTVAAGYTQETFYNHLENIAQVLKSVNGGQGPHLLSLIEVEDKTALQKLVDLKLDGMGYHTIALEEGQDGRGIDVGLITKYPMWPGSKPTLLFAPELTGQRGILRCELNINDKRTVVYVNHWKSMRDGEELSAAENKKIASVLKADFKATVAADPSVNAMVMGDLNTKFYGGDQRAMEELGATKSGEGLQPDQLWDATNTIVDRRAEGVEHPLLPAGTHGFRGEHDFLDRVMVNGNASTGSTGLKLDPDSVVVIPVPGRYFGKQNVPNINGLSDHNPVAFQLEVG